MDQDHYIIRSNRTKVISLTILGIVGLFIGIIGFHFYLIYMGVNIFELISEIIEVIGFGKFEIAWNQVLLLASLISAFVLAVINMKYSGIYTFYFDRFVTPKKEVIPYKNITRVIFNNSTIQQNILKYGTLIIEAGGTDKQSINIFFVDDIENKTKKLQDALYQYRTYEQQKLQQQNKINNIVDQW